MKHLIIKLFIIVLIAFSQSATTVSANSGEIARSSAKLITASVPKDNRALTLRRFLESQNSPMTPFAHTFIQEADNNNLDWKLVAAISGNESQFGHLIPPFSNNAWGYGVYGNNVRNFETWDEGIATVSKALRKDYLDSWGATNIYEIGAIYAEDPMWANKVSHYLSQIENFESENSSISISL